MGKKKKKTKIEGNNTQVHTDSEPSLFRSLSMDRYGQGNVLVVSGFVTDRPSRAISGDTTGFHLLLFLFASKYVKEGKLDIKNCFPASSRE